MSYRIVNRIVIEDGRVYIMDSPCDARPLRFLRREETAYTAALGECGLRGLMAAIATDIHRGEVRLRAGSLITRALRRGLHAITVEAFLTMEEAAAAERLAAMAEKVMLNWDYDPALEM